MANSKSGDSSLDRLVRILQSFDREVPAMTVRELAARAGLPLAVGPGLRCEPSPRRRPPSNSQELVVRGGGPGERQRPVGSACPADRRARHRARHR
ncbi:helix-turn-helix domain-containing protein [Arthrobacter sp.]|uniref:helix-turn-helix domain-containing protein n=1 Tax=Arthrobacter sp. TaxID=1667 RepID=UPI0025907C23|nr:helix-turn-helix domain-containing protein [Arthrobacter sp.]